MKKFISIRHSIKNNAIFNNFYYKVCFIIFIFLFCLLLYSASIGNIISDNAYKIQNFESISINLESSSEPIRISNNGIFSLYANGGGNGSISNPWIIENYTITSNNQSEILISISGTTDFFIIRNCILIGGACAINLINSANAMIENNTIIGTFYNSIYVYGNFENVTIKDNKINQCLLNEDSIACILVDYAKNVSIINNEIFNNTNFGESCIKYRDALYGTISSNIIHDNMIGGITLGNCNNMEILNNTISNSSIGIKGESSKNVIISYNVISGCNIGLSFLCHNISINFNTIFNNNFGIQTIESRNYNISFNNFIENGISDYFNNNIHILSYNCTGIIDSNFYHSNNLLDLNNDGISDIPMVFSIDNISDIHPKMNYYNLSNINYFTRPILYKINNELLEGEPYTGIYTLNWNKSIYYSTESVIPSITYSIWISNDYESTWSRISDYIEETTFSFNSSVYENGLNYSIKIMANNSLNQSSQIIIKNFLILKNIERPKILNLENNQKLYGKVYIKFSPIQINLPLEIKYTLFALSLIDHLFNISYSTSDFFIIDTKNFNFGKNYYFYFYIKAELYYNGNFYGYIDSDKILVLVIKEIDEIYSTWIILILSFISLSIIIYRWNKNFKKELRELEIS